MNINRPAQRTSSKQRKERVTYQLGLVLPFVLKLEILLNKQERREDNRKARTHRPRSTRHKPLPRYAPNTRLSSSTLLTSTPWRRATGLVHPSGETSCTLKSRRRGRWRCRRKVGCPCFRSKSEESERLSMAMQKVGEIGMRCMWPIVRVCLYVSSAKRRVKSLV
jgi:hypothetical protein